jgi:hypothetical protein
LWNLGWSKIIRKDWQASETKRAFVPNDSLFKTTDFWFVDHVASSFNTEWHQNRNKRDFPESMDGGKIEKNLNPTKTCELMRYQRVTQLDLNPLYT